MPPSKSPPSRSRSPRPQREEKSDRRSRSRSPRPQREERTNRRSRSRSPRRDRDNRDRRPRNDRGFRWKEKRNGNSDEPRSERRLERGYNNRDRDDERRRDSNRDRDDERRRDRRGPDRDGRKETSGGVDIADKFGVAAKFGSGKEETSPSVGKDTSKAPERAAPPPPAAVATGEPMIIVHVNDRLGTKAAIPCLASDPIKMFKAMVAARIGREPHEILLKRQGERPFKDQLTLEDYGVSNGVQLDLEVDTGD